MIYIISDFSGNLYRLDSDLRTGQITAPENCNIIGEETEVNPNGLDIECCDWDSVNLVIVPNQHKINLRRQNQQREFGEHLIKEIIDMMGSRNLDLINSGTQINIVSLASDNAGVKLLVETGGLSTAVALCGQLKIKYPLYADIYDYLILDINTYLSGKGWL